MKRVDAIALAALLVLAGTQRVRSLALIHDRGDQLIWAAIVANTSEHGFQKHSIRGVTAKVEPLAAKPELAVVRFEPATATSGKGNLLQGLIDMGEGYWDAPLANQPPGYTLILLGSHALVGESGDGFPLLGKGARATKDAVEWEKELAIRTAREAPREALSQLWAALPPVLSDLVTVALIFLGGTRLVSRRAALVAATAFALDPLAIFGAHRILSNSTLATACLSVLVLHAGVEKRWAFALGALAGFAILIKVSAIFLVPAFFAGALARYRSSPCRAAHGFGVHALCRGRGSGDDSLGDVSLASLARTKLLRGEVALALAAGLVAGPWLLVQWKVLGHPLGLAWQNQANYLEVSAWGRLVQGRGLSYYPSVLVHSPVALLGVVGAVAWLRGTPARATAGAFALLVLLAAHFHSGGKEARHILHVYPVLVLAGADLIERATASLPLSSLGGKVVALAWLGPVFLWQVSTGFQWAFDVAAIPP